MSIEQELSDELKDALRAGDAKRKNAIRAIQTEAARAKSEPGFGGDTDDAFFEKISLPCDIAGGEPEAASGGQEMAAKLGFEVEYLGRWLPQLLDEEATLELVKGAIEQLGASDPKEAGKVVGFVMKSHKGEVDGGLVNRLVRAELE